MEESQVWDYINFGPEGTLYGAEISWEMEIKLSNEFGIGMIDFKEERQ